MDRMTYTYKIRNFNYIFLVNSINTFRLDEIKLYFKRICGI